MNKSRYRYNSVKRARRKYNARYYAKTANAINDHQPWNREDLILVKNHTISDHELSKKLGRSVAAIQTIRNAIKKGRFNYYGI